MAKLDKFIQAMLSKPNAELRMAPSAEPAVFFDDQRWVLMPQKPRADQVRRLLQEVAPESAMAGLQAGGRASFRYQAPGQAEVTIAVDDWNGKTGFVMREATGAAVEVEASRVLAPTSERPSNGATAEPATPTASNGPGGPAFVEPTPNGHREPSSGAEPRSSVMASNGHAIDALFQMLVETGSSDLHVSSNEVPMIRKDGEMARLDYPRLNSDQIYELLKPIMPETNQREFEADGDTDFAYAIEGLARFRANMFRDRFGVGAVFRTIPAEILTAEQLGLPPAIQNLTKLSKGLVLVTGPTGSGKSTTLCALIDLINRTRSAHIITIEDPIEFVHENKRCLINQREVGVHTHGFKRALRAALREDPDIVLVGEMRDLETIAIAIETAETGHLVFGTLHTSTAYSTIDRIIDQFPPDQQEQIRVMLSESLRGVISQTLCKKIGGGRVAALEVLLSTPAVSNLIREGKTFQIPSVMQTARGIGMVLLNDALHELVKARKVAPEEAMLKAIDKPSLENALRASGLAPA